MIKIKWSKKIVDFVRKIKEDRRLLSIIVVAISLIFVGIGSIAGYFVLPSSSIENELALSQAELKTCQKNLGECNNTTASLSTKISELEKNISKLTSNLSNCKLEKENYKSSLENCTKMKNQISDELKSCKKGLITALNNLDEQKEKYKKLNKSYEEIKTNFAKNKCCPLQKLVPDYKYYTVSENDILCCRKEDKNYLCGPDEEKTSEEEVKQLIC